MRGSGNKDRGPYVSVRDESTARKDVSRAILRSLLQTMIDNPLERLPRFARVIHTPEQSSRSTVKPVTLVPQVELG